MNALRTGSIAIALWFTMAATLAVAQRESASTHAPEDWQKIRAVVSAQRDALVAGDGERAFGFAAPVVRRRYRTARAFMTMVNEGYRPLVEARYVEFLDGAIIEGSTIQPLRLVMPDGAVRVALYEMQRQSDGSWRIAGCVIAPSTVKAA